MSTKCAFLVAVIFAFIRPNLVLSADAKEFEPMNKNFTIMIPAGEHTGHQTRVIQIGKHNCAVEAAQCTAEDGTIYVGASLGIPAVVMRDVPADERFEILGDALAKGMKGKITAKKDLMQDPVPGKQFDMTTANGVVRLQLYTMAGWMMYAVVEAKSKEQLDGKDVDAFFASFKLSDSVKDGYRKIGR